MRKTANQKNRDKNKKPKRDGKKCRENEAKRKPDVGNGSEYRNTHKHTHTHTNTHTHAHTRGPEDKQRINAKQPE